MPNSGFQGQINQCFYGTHKGDLVPLGDRYVSGNLPNPAFWRRFIRDPVSRIESPSPRVLTTTEVLAPMRPSNIYTVDLSKQSDRSTSGTLPKLHTSSAQTTNNGSYLAPVPPHNPSTARGRARAREALIPLVALNSLAPFATSCKPTCGYFFSRGTDNKKHEMGIPATDLVKYRYYVK